VEIDGQFYTESSRIMQLIEEKFPEKKSLNLGGSGQLLQLERELFGTWLHWLRESESARARKDFEQAMDDTEAVLKRSSGPFFGGKDISIADCVFASSLERIAASILYYKGLSIRGERWPSVEKWFQEMDGRESYMASRSDFHTHVHDLPPQIGGCIASGTKEQQAAAAQIDGTDGRSWQLPLPALTVDSLEPGLENPVHDRLEAANALIHCHEGVIASSRGGEAADAAFQFVVQALMDGVENEVLQGPAGPLKLRDIDAAAAQNLRWTRDRISVPRDMSFAAARQLRAHLNWAADIIDPQKGWTGTPLAMQNRRDVDPAIFGLSTL
jgi:glutathione S-transferase